MENEQVESVDDNEEEDPHYEGAWKLPLSDIVSEPQRFGKVSANDLYHELDTGNIMSFVSLPTRFSSLLEVPRYYWTGVDRGRFSQQLAVGDCHYRITSPEIIEGIADALASKRVIRFDPEGAAATDYTINCFADDLPNEGQSIDPETATPEQMSAAIREAVLARPQDFVPALGYPVLTYLNLAVGLFNGSPSGASKRGPGRPGANWEATFEYLLEILKQRHGGTSMERDLEAALRNADRHGHLSLPKLGSATARLRGTPKLPG